MLFRSGVGLSRFVRPVLRTAWPVLLVVALLLLFVWPWGNRSSLELRERYQQRSDLSRVTPGVFQSSSDGRRVFFVERESSDGINARNVFILSRQEANEAVTSARSGRLETQGDSRFLLLERGQRNDVNGASGERTLSSFETYRVLAPDQAARSAEDQPPRVLATLDLIQRPTPRNKAELAWRFGLMLGAANLTLLGIGLAATNPRRASNWNLLFALLTFLVYYNLINLSQAWVASERVDIGGVLVVLHGSAFLLALALLWWREHGTAGLRRWRRRPRSQTGAAA